MFRPAGCTWENTYGFWDVKGVSIPAAVTVFPHEIWQAPRSWVERAYPNLIYFNEVDRGNHLAAWQRNSFSRGSRGIPVTPLTTHRRGAPVACRPGVLQSPATGLPGGQCHGSVLASAHRAARARSPAAVYSELLSFDGARPDG